MRWDRVSFVVGSEEFTWGDVVAATLASGADGTRSTARSVRASAAFGTPSEAGSAPTDAQVDAAAVAFRTERKLFAAEDFETVGRGARSHRGRR